MAAMTASFNLAGDSFGLMMKKVTDKFDTLDSKLDDLETKRALNSGAETRRSQGGGGERPGGAAGVGQSPFFYVRGAAA